MENSIINYPIILFGIIFLSGLVVSLLGKRGIRFGFILWIWMFSLGFRAIHITSHLSLHPLVAFMGELFCLMFIIESIFKRKPIPWPVPKLLVIFSIFWLWGWIPGLLNGWRWDEMLSEFLNFLMIFPILSVTAYFLAKRNSWRPVILAFFSVGTFVALTGVTEYINPEFFSFLPDFIQTEKVIIMTQDGFLRGGFSFFGNPGASMMCAFSLPMLLPLRKWYRNSRTRLLLYLAFAVQLMGIYVSGARAIWVLALISLVMLSWFRRGLIGVIIASALLLGIYYVLPEPATVRVVSLTSVLSGEIIDTSLNVRWNRALYAINLAIKNPAGVGWGGSGWVHSDVLQIAANLGILAALVFLAWYATTLAKAWRQYLKFKDQLILPSLITSFVLVGFVLATEGIEVLSFFALPAWFIWAMLEVRIREIQNGERELGVFPVLRR